MSNKTRTRMGAMLATWLIGVLLSLPAGVARAECAAAALPICLKQTSKAAPGLSNQIGQCAALRQCKNVCRDEKRDCRQDARADKKACLDHCRARGFSLGGNRCKGACRQLAKKRKEACRHTKRVCKTQCRGNFRTPECRNARAAANRAAAMGVASCAAVAACIVAQ